jgi:hypothetical protein
MRLLLGVWSLPAGIAGTDQIIKAIKRPTLKEPIDDYGVPFEHYHFAFEEGLPEMIARDLESRALAGGKLPVLQVVCDRLYAKTRPADPNASWLITRRDYEALGSIEQQMEENVNLELEQLCRDSGIRYEPHIRAEIERWKDMLATLAKSRPDGTVTTDMKSVEELATEATKARCTLDLRTTIAFLTRDGVRILRREDLVRLGSNEIVECYSLGHDAVGLVLYQWGIKRRAEQARRRGMRIASFSIAIVFAVVGVLIIAFTSWDKFFGTLMLIYAATFLLGTSTQVSDMIFKIMLSVFALYPKRFRERILANKNFADMAPRYPRILERLRR